MQLIKTAFHPDISPDDISATSKLSLIVRHAARGIVIKGETILLLFTERYHDYSLPGGGIDEGEDEVAGLIREITRRNRRTEESEIYELLLVMTNTALGINLMRISSI